MVTEMLLAAVDNTTASTAATQNGLDIGDYYTGIVAFVATAITFALTYRHGSQSEQHENSYYYHMHNQSYYHTKNS
jgi:hypothetical protein